MPGGLVRYPGWLTLPLALAALLAAVAALGWLLRRRGRASHRHARRRLRAGPGADRGRARWAHGCSGPRSPRSAPGTPELLDPYRPVWYRLAVVALAAAVLFTWYALTRRRIGPAALASAGWPGWPCSGCCSPCAVPGGAYLTTLPALAGALAGLVGAATRLDGPWPVVAVTAGRRGGRGDPAAHRGAALPGAGHGAWAGWPRWSRCCSAWPRCRWSTCCTRRPAASAACWRCGPAGSARCRPRAATLAAVVLAGVGLAVDRFDAAHPAPTHLMYALDAGTGQAAVAQPRG